MTTFHSLAQVSSCREHVKCWGGCPCYSFLRCFERNEEDPRLSQLGEQELDKWKLYWLNIPRCQQGRILAILWDLGVMISFAHPPSTWKRFKLFWGMVCEICWRVKNLPGYGAKGGKIVLLNLKIPFNVLLKLSSWSNLLANQCRDLWQVTAIVMGLKCKPDHGWKCPKMLYGIDNWNL